MFTHILTLTFTCSYTQIFTLTDALTHSHTLSHLLSHSHTLTHILPLHHTCMLTRTRPHTFTFMFMYTVMFTHILSHMHTLIQSHFYTHTFTHGFFHTHGHTHTCLAHTSSPTAGQTCAPCPLEVWVGGLQGRRLCGEPAWRAPWPSEPALSCGQCEHSRKGVAWPPVPWEDLVQKASQADMVTCREPHRDAAEQSTCRGSCADAGESRTNAAPLSLGNITPALPWDSGARQAEGGENHIK